MDTSQWRKLRLGDDYRRTPPSRHAAKGRNKLRVKSEE